MLRVEIPTYTDCWARGDRYGEVVNTTLGTRKQKGVDAVYHVKLDKSGKTVKVVAGDCREV